MDITKNGHETLPKLEAVAEAFAEGKAFQQKEAALLEQLRCMEQQKPGFVQMLARQFGTRQHFPKPTCMADIEEEAVRWLWFGWLIYGKLNIISGDPGNFKSGITLDIAARLTTERPMPFCELADPPANVLILFSEDGAKDTVKPRLRVAGADMKRVHFHTPRDLPEFDFMHLDETLQELSIRLMIIDPLFGFVPEQAEGKSSITLRRNFLNPLAELAEKHQVAIVGLVHLNKMDTGQNALYRSTGRLDYIAAARSAILIGKEPKENPTAEETFVMASNKMNLCRPPQSLRYHIESQHKNAPPYVVWDGIAEEYTAQNLLSSRATEREPSQKAKAVMFLREFLNQGARLQTEIEQAATEAGIASPTLQRAKKEVALSVKAGDGGRWMWKLREQEDQEDQATSSKKSDHQEDDQEQDAPQGDQVSYSQKDDHLDHLGARLQIISTEALSESEDGWQS